MKEKLVLVGNGMAGVRTLEELLKLAPDDYQITVFGEEPYGNYNRIMLSPVLAGDKTIEEIMLNDEQWYADNDIKLHKGKKVVEIDRINRKVIAEDGTVEEYDRLLLATGSQPFIIPVPGNDLEGVISFRDIHDVDLMLDGSKNQVGRQHQSPVQGGLGVTGQQLEGNCEGQEADITCGIAGARSRLASDELLGQGQHQRY